MTKLQNWTFTALAAAVLVAGILLATATLSFAQEGDEATPTPTATAESTGDAATATPIAESTDGDDSTDGADSADGEDSTDADDSTDDGEDSDGQGRVGGCSGGKGLILEAAAGVLGLTEDELTSALQGGQTLAEIAETQGMTAEDFKAALVDSVTADLQVQLDAGDITQEEFDDAIADLDEKVDDVINSEGGLRFHHRFGDGGEDADTTSAT